MAHAKQVVLVVEDEPLLRMAAVDLVEQAGFEAIEAADSTQAVGIFDLRLDIRIVFTDIDMPRGLDGMKVAVTVRDRWPTIEIIIVSGQMNSPDVPLPARTIFFSKPHKEHEIVAALNRFAA